MLCASTCTAEAGAALAFGHSCADRIRYLRTEENLSEAAACHKVAELEFPDTCGACSPTAGAQRTRQIRFPTLHVLGAEKAASSSLFGFLQMHFGLCGSNDPDWHTKEPKVWYNHMALPQASARDYLSIWSLDKPLENRRRPDDARCFGLVDGNPARLKSITAPAALMRFASAASRSTANLRLVSLLRSPIARHLSWYNHMLVEPGQFSWLEPRSCRDKWSPVVRSGMAPSFAEKTQCELDDWQSSCPNGGVNLTCYSARARRDATASGVMIGMYLAQLHQWRGSGWRRDQMLVLQMERLLTDPADSLSRLSRFLGFSPPLRANVTLPWWNELPSACKQRAIECRTRDTLQLVYQPWNDALAKSLARDQLEGAAPESEPAFITWGDEAVNCTDARKPQVKLAECRAPP